MVDDVMLRWLESVTHTVADYTVGSVIVLVHIATADRHERRERLLAP